MERNIPKNKWVNSALYMGTVVTITVVDSRIDEVGEKVERAFAAFQSVEKVCSRFDDDSELRRLSTQVDTPIRVSPILFEAVRFAWEIAHRTGGVFDPTVGGLMEQYGFNRHHLTGRPPETGRQTVDSVSYRDVILDQRNRTIRLAKPLILDLGAVAKGMAVDWAARELASLEGFVIDAGGDLFVKGFNEWGKPWRIGVRHPVNQKETIASFQLTDAAVCTSGSYERISPNRADTHHLIDPGTGRSRSDMLSCTVIAPFAMMADAFSTAAFLLGPQRGNELLKEVGLDGLWITSSLKMYHTEGMERYLYESNGISHSLSS